MICKGGGHKKKEGKKKTRQLVMSKKTGWTSQKSIILTFKVLDGHLEVSLGRWGALSKAGCFVGRITNVRHNKNRVGIAYVILRPQLQR